LLFKIKYNLCGIWIHRNNICVPHACFSKSSLRFFTPKNLFFNYVFTKTKAPKNHLIKRSKWIYLLSHTKISPKIKNNLKPKFFDIISTFSCNFKVNTRIKLLLSNGLLTPRSTILMAKINFNRDFIFLPLEFGYSLFSLKLKIKKWPFESKLNLTKL